MRNWDSCRCWRCTFCPCKVRNRFLVNFWNCTIHLWTSCIYRRWWLLHYSKKFLSLTEAEDRFQCSEEPFNHSYAKHPSHTFHLLSSILLLIIYLVNLNLLLISHMCFFTCTYNLPSNYLSNGNSLGYVQPSLEIWNNGKWRLPWLAYKIFSFFGHVNPWNKKVNLSSTYTGIYNSPCFLSYQETSPQHSLITRHLTAKYCKISRNLVTSSAYTMLNGSWRSSLEF